MIDQPSIHRATWAAGGTPIRVFALFTLALCIAFGLLKLIALHAKQALGLTDFFGLWSFARFARSHAPALLYQPAVLNAYQQVLAPAFKSFFPFPYPPDILLLLTPFGWLPYAPARAVWTILGVLLFAAAVWRMLAPHRAWRWFGLILILVAPASLANVLTGETGYLSSALFIGGFCLLPKRPLLAGLLFGLLTIKPQLGVLIPAALLGLGAWRCIFSATVTAAALVLFSCIAFPPALWLDWLQALPHYQVLIAGNGQNLDGIMTTVYGACRSVGLTASLANWLQLFATLVCAALVFLAFRAGTYQLAFAALLAAASVAAPHAFIYDAPIGAAAALLFAEALSTAGGFSSLQIAACFLAVMAPATAGSQSYGCLSNCLGSLLLFGVILRCLYVHRLRRKLPLDFDTVSEHQT